MISWIWIGVGVIHKIMLKKYKTIDLFCGCGGMSLGFENAGFDILAAYDNWKPAVNVYELNFKHPICFEDLSKPEIHKQIAKFKPNVIIGGPPCQDFSSAGHRNINLGRAILTYTYRDIVLYIKPQYFIMENVPEITKSIIYREIVCSFNDAGYGLTERILDASYCGVPQSRKRFFLIGSLGDKDDFLQLELDKNLSKKPMSMRDYFGDSLGIDYYFRVPRSYSRRGIFSIDEPCQTIRGVDRPIPPGYTGHPSDPIKIGPGVRALTIEERSYVQTFPKNFVFQGNKTDLNQMIGNAVPVKLAEYVANALRCYDRKQKWRKENANG